MNQLVQALPSLHAAIAGLSTCGIMPGDIDGYVRAITRKAKFATYHLRVLEGITWNDMDGLGRVIDGGTPARLTVTLDEVQLEFAHPEAVVDFVYLAFDGLTAAVINMTDTLGRLVNGVYSLGLDQRQASLIAVKGKCTATSALGTVLHDAKNTDWLIAVRELRGQCQHAAVEDVLVHRSGPYAQRGEPVVHQQFSWQSPKTETPIVSYARDAVACTQTTMIASVAAITSCPKRPTS